MAFARGVAPGRRDRHAARLLPGPLGRLVAFASERPLIRHTLRGLSLGLVDHVALRTAAMDAVVDEAVEASIAQVVILGAGLDARAWRFADCALQVFEVDHPATQRAKRERAPRGEGPVYVPVRFGEERLADALDRAGHRGDEPTLWIWEGVTMYLPSEAVEGTLRQVAERSAPGSLLAMSYLSPRGLPFRNGLRPVVEWSFCVLGEGLEARFRPQELAQLLRGHGFRVRRDGGSDSWPGEWGGDARLAGVLFASERICVAERPPVGTLDDAL